MRAAFAIAALVGSSMAAPSYGYGSPKEEVKNVHVVVETVVQTVYVTEGYEAPAPTPTPEAVYEAPVVTTVVYEEPSKPSQVYEAPVEAPVKPTPTPEAPKPTSAAPAPAPTGTGYMAVVDEYRQKMGLKPLIQDSKLEANAMDVVVAGNGNMVHKLNPGTFGQVLAPGEINAFKRVFVGGWLCEKPELLKGECQQMSEGWDYQGQDGHAKILTDDNYSKIGCNQHKGIWCCDLA